MLLDWGRSIHRGGVNIRQCVEGSRRLDVHGGGQRPGCPDTRTIEGLDLKRKPWPLGRAAGLGLLMSRHFQNVGLDLTSVSFQNNPIPLCLLFLFLCYNQTTTKRSLKREKQAKQIPHRVVKAHTNWDRLGRQTLFGESRTERSEKQQRRMKMRRGGGMPRGDTGGYIER